MLSLRPLRFLLALACLLAAATAHAERTPFQIRCEDSLSKTVTVLSAQQSGYTVDTHLSYMALTSMHGLAAGAVKVAGLTQTDSRVKMGYTGTLLQDSDSGYECIAPRIEVKLYYVPVVIYVAREFPAGSCAYKEILKHELRHMNAYMEHLPKVEKTVREALAKRFQDKPLYAPSGTAMSALTHEVDNGWMDFIKAEMRKVDAVQANIDSPEEYAHLSETCGGEIRNVLSGGHAF